MSTDRPLSVLAEGRDITDRKLAEVALRESEDKYRSLVETAIAGIASIDLEGKFTFANDRVCLWTGLTRADIVGQPFADFVHPDDLPGLMEMFLNTAGSEIPIPTIEFRIIQSDGQIIWLHTNPTPIILNGKTVGFNTILYDITERKKAEDALRYSETFLKSIIEKSPHAMWISDSSGTLIKLNQACRDLLNITDEEVVGKYNVLEDNIVEEQGFMPLVRDVFKKGDIAKFTLKYDSTQLKKLKLQRKAYVILEVTISPVIGADGKITNAIIQHVDITERNRAEEALKASEAQYRLLSDHMTDIVWLMDMNLKTTYQSPSVQRIGGFTLQENEEMPLEKHLTPESLKIATDTFLEEMAKIEADPGYNFTRTLELEFYHKDGTTFWAENTFSLIRDENGRPLSILGEGRNISDRKLAEIALKESEEKYRTLFNKAPVGIAISTTDGTIIDLNEAQAEMIGFSVKELRGKNVGAFYVNPDQRRKMIEIFQKDGKLRDFEVQLRSKDGSIIDELLNFDLVQMGGSDFIFATGRDITKLRQAEKAMRESEDQYRLLSEHTTDTVWLMDMNLKITYTSPSSEKLLGFTHQELMEMPLEKYLTPDSLRLAAETFFKEMPRVEADPDYNPVLIMELEYCCKDGTTLWAENKFNLIRDENGKPVSILGETRDITKRLQAEETLRQSEAKYRTVLEQIEEAYYEVDLAGNLTFFNDATCRQLGYSIEELMGMNYRVYTSKDDMQLVYETFNQVYRTGKPITGFSVSRIRKDGTRLFTENSALPMRNKDGKIIGFRGIARDITERRETERKLWHSMTALEKTLADTVIAISKMVEMKDPFTAGHQIRVAQLASAMAKNMNLTKEQVAYLNTAATIHDIGKIYVPSDILSKPGKLGAIEFQIIQTHVQGSYDILKEIDFSGPIAQIVYQHHERLDGSGYPRGLKGADILPEAKILIVADVVEAMSSHRPYRAALGIEKALEEITDNRGSKYDEAAVDACLELFRNNQFEFKPV